MTRNPRQRQARGRSRVGERFTAVVGPVAHGGHFIVRLPGEGRVVFTRHALPGAVTLRANTTYYLASEETAASDAWYDYDTRVVTASVASQRGVVYAFAGSPANWVAGGGQGMTYGPVSFLYS